MGVLYYLQHPETKKDKTKQKKPGIFTECNHFDSLVLSNIIKNEISSDDFRRCQIKLCVILHYSQAIPQHLNFPSAWQPFSSTPSNTPVCPNLSYFTGSVDLLVRRPLSSRHTSSFLPQLHASLVGHSACALVTSRRRSAPVQHLTRIT